MSLQGFQLLKEALLPLQCDVFFKEDDNVHLYMLADLRGMVASSSNESLAFSRNFQENSLFSEFDHFIDDARNINETFTYWDTFIYLMQQK